jgi:hypothetical protein
MGRRNTIFYVFVSFLIIGLIAVFSPILVFSLLVIILAAIIFKYIIGVNWRDSFMLSALNSIWIFAFYVFYITGDMVSFIMSGSGFPERDFSIAVIIIAIGVPVTTIALNWGGKRRHYEASILDKFFGFKTKRGHHSKHQSKPNNYLFWFFTFTLGFWISTLLMPFFDVTNIILLILFSGLVIELTSKIMQKLVYKRRISVDKHFIFWVLIQSVGVYLAKWLYPKLPHLDFPYAEILIIGLIITVFINIIWKLDLERKLIRGGSNAGILILVIVIVIVFFVYNPSFFGGKGMDYICSGEYDLEKESDALDVLGAGEKLCSKHCKKGNLLNEFNYPMESGGTVFLICGCVDALGNLQSWEYNCGLERWVSHSEPGSVFTGHSI